MEGGSGGPGPGSGGPGPGVSTSLVAGAVSSLRRLSLGSEESEIVQVKFCLKYRTQFGQTVKLIGGHPKLGNWDLNKSLELKWSEGDRWIAMVDLPAGGVYEYKYVLLDHDTRQPLAWQQGGNAVLALGDNDDQGVEVQDNWGNAPGQAAVLANGQSVTREAKLQAWVNEFQRYKAEAKTAQLELTRKAEEVQAAKAQVARLKMELSLASKARDDLETKVSDLESQNMSLRAEVANSQMAMKSTLEEAIRLLQNEVDGESETDDAGEEEAAASSSSGGWGWGFSSNNNSSNGAAASSNGTILQHQDKEYVYSHSNSGSDNGNGVGRTFERFGIRLGLGGDDAGASNGNGHAAGSSSSSGGGPFSTGGSSSWGFRFGGDNVESYSPAATAGVANAAPRGTWRSTDASLGDWRSRIIGQ